MKIDAAASMRCWGIWVSVAGREYPIPPLPAGPWLMAITSSYRQVIPGMVYGPDADDLIDLMVSGRVGIAEMDEAARDAITEVSGMKWWTAARLASWMMGNWETLGTAVLSRGLDMATAPLGAVLAVGYRVILENAKDEQARQRVDMELDKPPVGVPVEQIYDPQVATAAFMALAAADGD